MKLIAYLGILLFAIGAQAEPKKFVGTYGPEFTFGDINGKEFGFQDLKEFLNSASGRLLSNRSPADEFDKFHRFQINGRFGFFSQKGWEFTTSTDPWVLEIQIRPMTVEKYKKFADAIQDAVFVTAAKNDLVPMEYLGGGHINIDIASFRGNALLLRNFIVDYWNHNELALGILNYDTNNALSIWLQDEKYLLEVKEILEKFDNGIFFLNDPENYLYNFLAALNGSRSKSEDFLKSYWSTTGPFRYKSTDITFVKATRDHNRLEVRAVRPQKTIFQWIKQIELFDARINYLAQLKGPLPLKSIVPLNPIDQANITDIYLDPPVDPQDALRAYYLYVTDSGLRWQDYRSELWPKWERDGEIENFENSKWFKSRESKCGDLL